MSEFRQLDPGRIRAHRETVLLRLLIRVGQAETNELTRRLHDRGHRALQASYIRVLGNIDTEGTRLVTLGQRLGVTRQAASQLVGDIEGRGYLERVPDRSDGRAVLVRHTAPGRELLADALAAMAAIETEYEEIIGPARMRTLRTGLRMLADAVDPAGALGH